MKRILIFAVVIMVSAITLFGKKLVAEGKTYTQFGNYKIEIADNPVTMKGEDCVTYLIRYEDTPMEVTVIIFKDKKCKRYVVLSDKLSVQYVCYKNYFGVEKLGTTFEAEGYRTSDSALNRSEYFHQKVICPGQGNEVDNTMLIAVFFPMLISNNKEYVSIY